MWTDQHHTVHQERPNPDLIKSHKRQCLNAEQEDHDPKVEQYSLWTAIVWDCQELPILNSALQYRKLGTQHLFILK